MQAQRRYSDYFATLHDEAGPVGSLGGGTHYSVLRGVAWTEFGVTALETAHTHDFAVVWDEDHDEQVIDVVELLLEADLLSPVLFIGERADVLTVILDQRFLFGHPKDWFKSYLDKLRSIADSVEEDPWTLEVGHFDSTSPLNPEDLPTMIDCGALQQEVYLRNIDNLWQLGTKPLVRHPATRIMP